MSGFEALKKAAGTLNAITEKMSADRTTGTYSKDERFWSLDVDKAGNGYAVIRFLPEPEKHDLPYVRTYSHSFKEQTKWYIEDCPTTIGGDCPVCEANSALWNTGVKEKKDIASKRKRIMKYVGNIFVVSDPKNPENEGKVFLFKYGKTIYDMITGAITPEFQDEVAMNPYDLWTGANFKLKARLGDNRFRDLGKSEFESPSALLGGDDALLERLWKSEYSLKEFLDPAKFKTHEVLLKKFNSVINPTAAESSSTNSNSIESKFAGSRQVESQRPKITPPKQADVSTEDDDMEAYRKLLEDDDAPF